MKRLDAKSKAFFWALMSCVFWVFGGLWFLILSRGVKPGLLPYVLVPSVVLGSGMAVSLVSLARQLWGRGG